MNGNLVLSHRVMQLLREWLLEDLWYSQERRDMFEEDCDEYEVYRNAVNEDKKLIKQLDIILAKEKESPLLTKAVDDIFNNLFNLKR